MKLYDFLKVTQRDYDTEDTVYCACVTVCYIEEDESNDSYDRFCIELMKKVEVKTHSGTWLQVNWSELIRNNLEHFKAFTKEHWNDNCQYEDDVDELVYQWINEIHQYMAGNVWEELYDELVKLVSKLKA